MSQVDSNSAQAKGIEHLKAAIAADEKGQVEKAVTEYTKGIDFFFAAIKTTRDPAHRAKLRKQITQYLARAELLKGHTTEKKTSNVPKDLRQRIEDDVLELGVKVTFDDIAGLDDVKEALNEMVIYPAMRPDLFTGLRTPPRGLLMFGPPGNGKTYIARAVASESNATFFNVSASTLVSRYMGDSEKLVRALFEIAREKQPSIIFIDEIDSVLSRRSGDEHEASRRLKTEFMVQFNALNDPDNKDHVVVIGATNIPEQLDDAVIRRLSKRIFVPMPEATTRRTLIKGLLKKNENRISDAQLEQLVAMTDGYSCSDLKDLCRDAAMGPVRDLAARGTMTHKDSVPTPITFDHFREALANVAPSVTAARLGQYHKWHEENAGAQQRLGGARANRRSYSKPNALPPGPRPVLGGGSGGRQKVVTAPAQSAEPCALA